MRWPDLDARYACQSEPSSMRSSSKTLALAFKSPKSRFAAAPVLGPKCQQHRLSLSIDSGTTDSKGSMTC